MRVMENGKPEREVWRMKHATPLNGLGGWELLQGLQRKSQTVVLLSTAGCRYMFTIRKFA